MHLCNYHKHWTHSGRRRIYRKITITTARQKSRKCESKWCFWYGVDNYHLDIYQKLAFLSLQIRNSHTEMSNWKSTCNAHTNHSNYTNISLVIANACGKICISNWMLKKWIKYGTHSVFISLKSKWIFLA